MSFLDDSKQNTRLNKNSRTYYYTVTKFGTYEKCLERDVFMVFDLLYSIVKNKTKAQENTRNTRNSSSREYESTARLPWIVERQARHFTGTVFASLVWLGQGSGPQPSALEKEPYLCVAEAVKFISLHVKSLSCHLQLRRVHFKNKWRKLARTHARSHRNKGSDL